MNHRPSHKFAADRWKAGLAFMLTAAAIGLPCHGQTTNTTSPAATNTAPAKPTYKFIADRNIFNPNRYPGSGEGRIDPRRLAVAPGFSLVGTMTYEKGTFAFFDGTDSQYRKVLQASGTIADYRVTEITPTNVALEASTTLTSTNHVTLAVGMQLKRVGDGDWQLAAGSEFSGGSSDGGGGGGGGGGGRSRDRGNRSNRWSDNANNSGSPQPAAPTTSVTTSSAGGGNSSDVLRRMMQQREREMQR